MEQGNTFEDKLEQLRRVTEQIANAQQRAGVELDQRLGVALREHLYHHPCTDEAVLRLVRSVSTLPEWLCEAIAYGRPVDRLVDVGIGLFALHDGAGRWMLVDLNEGLVSDRLWESASEAVEAAGRDTVSWSEPVDDEPAVDEYEVATCIGCGCDDMHACWDEAAGSPCSWLRVDREAGLGVCSACPDDVARWDAGDREIAVPVAVRELEQGL